MRDSLVRFFGALLAGSIPLLAGGPAAVPEPSSIVVVAVGAAGMLLLARKIRRR